jgi:hypothetical protein
VIKTAESTTRLTPEQIEAALQQLTADELHQVGKAVAKDASRRLRKESK